MPRRAIQLGTLGIILGLMVWLSSGPGQTTQASHTTDVTVRITRVLEIEDQDGVGGGDGDFFAEVKIGGFDFEHSAIIEDDDFNPDWRFTRNVTLTGPIDIIIRLWDSDDGFAGAKDFADISPKNNDVELNIRFDGHTGRWDFFESDVQGNVAQGDGDHGFPEPNDGRIARIEFQIYTGTNPDTDGDGIADSVENMGIRRDDGSVAVDLRAMGADPCRKTILLELDWMQGAADGHNHRPKDAAITEIQTSFANAPVPATAGCPYVGFGNTGGVQLLIDRSNSIPEQAVFTLNDLDNTRNNPANFDPLRRPYYHYAVFAHDQAAGSSSSGRCCRQGKDFIVTLGSWRKVCVAPGANGTLQTSTTGDDVIVSGNIEHGPDRTCNTTVNATSDDIQVVAVGAGAADYAVGTVRDQSSTIMHELGHSLGLEHRGRDDVNHAPNYLSNMNYAFQAGIPFATQPGSALDYSRTALPTLTEASLNENTVLDATSNFNTFWYDPTRTQQMARVSQPINWDQTAAGPIVNVDINADSGCIRPGADGNINSTPGGDDAIANGIIHNGPNDTCESSLSGDDVFITTGFGGTPLNQTCVGGGANEKRDTPKTGDDVEFSTEVNSGPNLICDTAATGDDIQVVPVGKSEPPSHPGWDDWSNLRYRAAESPYAAGPGAGHEGDQTFFDILFAELRFAELIDPDLKATKTVDKTDAKPGDTLTYTATAENVGTGEATEVSFSDTLPLSGGVVQRSASNIIAGQSHQETFTYRIPCGTPDGTVLVNSVVLSAKNLQAQPEVNTANNTATASTTVHAPVMTLTKTATSTVNAGEAIIYRLTYENTGSASALSVAIADTLPAGVYYSAALDLGAGPLPTSATLNADGTRTLTWNIGTVVANSGPVTIEFTARPTLLSLGGTEYINNASLTFTDANGCVYPTVSASASTRITVVPPTRDPGTLGFWRSHNDLWTAEILARIQATDQRYDTDGDGAFSETEATAMFAPGGNQPKVLQMQLLATYFNLATRRINADTVIESKTSERLGLDNVAEAVVYTMNTLALPVNAANRPSYDDATKVLDEINSNKSEVY